MPRPRHQHPSRSAYSQFERLRISHEWFEVYRITEALFVFYEPRHYEETIVSLLVGHERATLIDTGCGIGDLRKVVEQVTDKPVTVVNTHTHLDHLGSNGQFDEIAMFDHPRSRRVAAEGASRSDLQAELLAEHLVDGPWPAGFDPAVHEVPPWKVARWLEEGDRIDLGGRELEVIHTPGEAPDHVCLLDRVGKILFCGDILLHGAVWTQLDGGSLDDLIASYRKLMTRFDEFDHLMPAHNVPWLDKALLPEALAGAEAVAAGQVQPEAYVDPWGRRLKRYVVGRFEVLTP